MNRRGLILVALLLIPLLPASSAQVGMTTDVQAVSLGVGQQPIVNLESVVGLLVSNPGSTDSYVSVRFSYADGTLLNGTVQGSTNARLVPAGSQVNLTLFWTPGPDRAGKQTIHAQLSASGDTNSSNDAMDLDVFIQAPAWSLTVENATSNATTIPFGTAFLRYHAKNLGNSNDTPIITPISSNGSWNATLLGFPVPVPPGKEAVGDILLLASTDNASYNESINVTLVSALDANVQVKAQTSDIHVDQNATRLQRSFELTGLPAQSQIFPGESLNLTGTLRNTGAVDLVLDVNVSNMTSPGWSVAVDAYNGSWVQPNQSIPLNLSVALRPGESRDLRFTVNASAASGASDALDLNVTMRDAPLLLAIVPEGTRVRATVALVPSIDDVRVANVSLPEPVYRGDDIQGRILVENHGRAPANATNLTVVLSDELRTLGQWTLPVPALAAGASASIPWSTSDAQFSGDVTLAVRLTGVNSSAPEGHATAHVRDPVLAVQAPEGIDVVPGGQLNLTGARGGLLVHLSGDRPETVAATLTGGEPWVQASWTVDVPAGGDVVLPLRLAVPEFPHTTHVDATLSAQIVARPRVNATTALEMVVDDQEGPTLAPAPPANGTAMGAPALLAATADDATGVASVEVLVKTPSGQATLLLLARNASAPGRYEAPYTPQEPGAYTLAYRAVDSTPEAHATALAPLTWTVSGPSYAGFTLQPPPNSTVGSRVVRALEVEPGTTASLEVDLGAGEQPVFFPYDIHLDGWSDGRHTLTLHARSTKGEEWRATWSLTLDTTPPVITGHNLSAQPDGRLDVTLSTLEGANASAKFHTQSGDVVVPLDVRGAGRFEAIVAPPAGWSGVSLVAQDKAGNVASVDVDREVAKTPGPGLLGVAMAVALVALLLRRR